MSTQAWNTLTCELNLIHPMRVHLSRKQKEVKNIYVCVHTPTHTPTHTHTHTYKG